jgi:integrase
MTQFLAKERHTWRSVVHSQQWTNSLETHAQSLMSLDVRFITTEHILRVLTPFWETKTETASRVRQRIEAVLAWAIAAKHRSSDKCARWGGHLEFLLANPTDLKKARGIKRQPSIPYAELPAFMTKLRQREGVAALALEFLTLTAVRTADVMACKRADIDLKERAWRIASFSKTAAEHIVPLSSQALAVIGKAEDLTADTGSNLLFPRLNGQAIRKSAMWSEMAAILGDGVASPHGQRSAFRSWCQDADGVSREVAEAALGHKVYGAVEAAYARGDQLTKRRVLMQRWADFLAKSPSGDVIVPLRRGRKSI